MPKLTLPRSPNVDPTVGAVPSLPQLLPEDLSGALKYLDDQGIDRLLSAVIDEARRRDRLPPLRTPSPLSARTNQVWIRELCERACRQLWRPRSATAIAVVADVTITGSRPRFWSQACVSA